MSELRRHACRRRGGALRVLDGAIADGRKAPGGCPPKLPIAGQTDAREAAPRANWSRFGWGGEMGTEWVLPRLRGTCRTIGAVITLCAALWPAGSATAQSARTVMGMQAYNSGDIATAYKLLRQEADAGDSDAQVNLGYLYARGQHVPEDQGEALRLYLLSAEQGNGEGMNALGYKHQYGSGVPRNMDTAIVWYCRAVLAGNPRAMNNLAILLFSGEAISRNEEEARRLWQQAGAYGHVNAMANLGLSYLNGPGSGRDPVAGRHWMEQAALHGQRQAQAWLRANGYQGALPPPVDTSNAMTPSVRDRVGHSTVCRALTS
ncbi:tetratricopeptide repeat protein [Azorhizobium oxalatiphilum]|nr:tetratricopeptide repeat protein [Azorhizobium oxalatiphilum]